VVVPGIGRRDEQGRFKLFSIGYLKHSSARERRNQRKEITKKKWAKIPEMTISPFAVLNVEAKGIGVHETIGEGDGIIHGL
jgi:hypothetical protein